MAAVAQAPWVVDRQFLVAHARKILSSPYELWLLLLISHRSTLSWTCLQAIRRLHLWPNFVVGINPEPLDPLNGAHAALVGPVVAASTASNLP